MVRMGLGGPGFPVSPWVQQGSLLTPSGLKVVTAASATAQAGFNLPPGASPTTAVEGDMWRTPTGLFAYINGTIVQLNGGGGGGGGGLLTFASVAAVAAADIPNGTPAIATLGFSTPNDGGGAQYNLAPRAAANTIQSADGQAWAYAPDNDGYNPMVFGVVPDGVTDSLVPWYNALAAMKLYGQSGNIVANPNYSRATGLVSGIVFNVTGVGAGSVLPGMALLNPGASIIPGTIIQTQLSGTPGGIGNYQINYAQNIGPATYVLGQQPTIITFSVVAGVLVCNWPNHGLRINDGFVAHAFYGVLPSPVNEDQVYFVLDDSNFTANTFDFSAFNNFTSGDQIYPEFIYGPGPPVTGSSGGSGNYTAWASGNEFIKVVLPPGVYQSSETLPIMGSGAKNIEVSAYGAVFNNAGIDAGITSPTLDPSFGFTSWALIQSAYFGDRTITLLTSSQTSRFWVNQWLLIGGLSLQDAYNAQSSFPPNLQFHEYVQIGAISSGVITLVAGQSLSQNYLQTWPLFNPGPPIGFAPTGPACIYGMGFNWDAKLITKGAHFTNYYETGVNTREVHTEDLYFDGQGLTPSYSHLQVHTRLVQPNVGIEQDKLIDDTFYREGTIYGLEFESQGANNRVVVEQGCKVGIINGGGRQTVIRDSTVNEFFIGGGIFGACDRGVNITGSVISTFTVGPRFYDPGGATVFYNLVNNWTFNNGTIRYPIANIGSGGPNAWCIPGWKYFIADYAGRYQNMGSPFVGYDVYQDGSGNFCMDTSLTSMPVGSSSAQTVSLSGTSVSWGGSSVAINTPIVFLILPGHTGTLDTALTAGAVYYTLSSGTSFGISVSPGGSPISFNGNGTGTQSAVTNPLAFEPHYCTKLTILESSGCPAILDMLGAVNQPLYSQCHRMFGGYYDASFYYNNPTLWGNLTSLVINIVRPDTSGFGSPVLNITGNGFNNLIASNLNQVIDLTQGPRTVTITPTSHTSPVGNDSLSNYGSWLSGLVQMYPSGFSNSGNFNQKPLFEVFAYTNQGVTLDDLWQVLGAQQSGNTVTYFDTSGQGGR
jgi:hypothetical protein